MTSEVNNNVCRSKNKYYNVQREVCHENLRLHLWNDSYDCTLTIFYSMVRIVKKIGLKQAHYLITSQTT